MAASFSIILAFSLLTQALSYPYFVSYVSQIGVNWWYAYNTDLLSNLGVPGYSAHPYNVLNFAFWTSTLSNEGGTVAVGSAPDVWVNLATYITDTSLRSTLTGKTNPTSAELRQAIKDIYVANDIKIFIAAFGGNNHVQGSGANAANVGTALANHCLTYLYDGVDVDWEEGGLFNGAGEAWLTTLTDTLYSILNPQNKLITHAPQAPYFMGSTLNQYPQGGYNTVHQNVGSKIDWYNVQFYNQGSSTYSTYANMFQASVGWSSNSAVYQMINGNNPESVSIPSQKIVVGKHSLGDGSDFVSGTQLKNIFNTAFVNTPVWNTGFMCWQFYTENNQSPKFQVANEVVTANWDTSATLMPTPPTPAPVPTTPTPTGNGGGSGCVNGNICVRVKGFGGTPSAGTPVWWWAIYDDQIISSLTSGCAITDCSGIEVKQSHTNAWVTAYDENGDCGMQMGDNPFTSTVISVDFRITTTNGKVISSNGVVLNTDSETDWDFGANLLTCSDSTSAPTVLQPTNPPIPAPTGVPSPAPVPTTANPTTISGGGGQGCVNGNICVKVKGFASETPSPSAEVWWWAIYDEQIISSLTSGCAITDCTGIEVKQSHTNAWVTAYDENGDCSLQMGDNPLVSTVISVDMRITTTNGKVIQSSGVIQQVITGAEWDFGSNFFTCSDTAAPVRSPTDNPSSVPTPAPTTLPTSTPSYNPSQSPTEKPSTNPTKYPTDQPSTSPSKYPTDNPAVSPTDQPSQFPTDNPSNRPSSVPTNQPTVAPTTKQTSTPSGNPTKSPSDPPSATPSETPSENPSNDPTTKPTKSPIIPGSPTRAPSDTTATPTDNPTETPSNHPSQGPTENPTKSPSDTPTVMPSDSPTENPSGNPTDNPTQSPSDIPTVTPSQNPTATPTVRPSQSPSESPSSNPTYSPTTKPSDSPITPGSPTRAPSDPTPTPTDIPTNIPSDNPSQTPTDNPSAGPSVNPTEFPTDNPSMRPSDSPITPGSPTRAPTDISPSPTDNPSAKPTDSPIIPGSPTKAPTIMTPSPTDLTSNPTKIPTVSPTPLPTENPTEMCNDSCESSDEDGLHIIAIFWFPPWIIYDFSGIECWLYRIFLPWFVDVSHFDSCDFEVSVIGGSRNNGILCPNGPCLWNRLDTNRRLLQNDFYGNASIVIVAEDEDIFEEINTLSLASIVNELQTQFNEEFEIEMEVRLEVVSEENNGSDEDSGDSLLIGGKHYTMTELIIGGIIVLGLVFLLFMMVVCVCMRYKKKKGIQNKKVYAATEMIFAPTMKLKQTSTMGLTVDGIGSQTNIKPVSSVDEDDDALFVD